MQFSSLIKENRCQLLTKPQQPPTVKCQKIIQQNAEAAWLSQNLLELSKWHQRQLEEQDKAKLALIQQFKQGVEKTKVLRQQSQVRIRKYLSQRAKEISDMIQDAGLQKKRGNQQLQNKIEGDLPKLVTDLETAFKIMQQQSAEMQGPLARRVQEAQSRTKAGTKQLQGRQQVHLRLVEQLKERVEQELEKGAEDSTAAYEHLSALVKKVGQKIDCTKA